MRRFSNFSEQHLVANQNLVQGATVDTIFTREAAPAHSFMFDLLPQFSQVVNSEVGKRVVPSLAIV
jgi:hypothetical protein